jgi:hypothetical protein
MFRVRAVMCQQTSNAEAFDPIVPTLYFLDKFSVVF